MRQLGAIAVLSTSPKLTDGAEVPTNHPVTALDHIREASPQFVEKCVAQQGNNDRGDR